MSRKWVHVVILLSMGLLLIAGSLAAQKNQKEPIKVFILTSANVEGFTDADQKQRSDSVEDLRKVLAGNALVQVVSQQGAADIALEVLGRGREENGSSTSRRGYGGTVYTSNNTQPVVRVAIHAGSYSTEIDGFGGSNQLFWAWHTAANNAAHDVEKWIKANYQNLMNRRFSEEGSVGATQDAASSPQVSSSPEAVRAYQESATAGSSSGANETGTVRVVSAPIGADIYVDGRFVGNSPAELKVNLGGHVISAKLQGFKDWQREITIGGGAVNLNAMLVAGTNATAGAPQASRVTETQASPVAVPPAETPTKIDATGPSGWIGVVTQGEGTNRVVISQIVKESAAAHAGLQVGDTILELNGAPVKSGEEFDVAISHFKPGSQIRVSYIRGAWKSEVTLTVGKIGF